MVSSAQMGGQIGGDVKKNSSLHTCLTLEKLHGQQVGGSCELHGAECLRMPEVAAPLTLYGSPYITTICLNTHRFLYPIFANSSSHGVCLFVCLLRRMSCFHHQPLQRVLTKGTGGKRHEETRLTKWFATPKCVVGSLSSLPPPFSLPPCLPSSSPPHYG